MNCSDCAHGEYRGLPPEGSPEWEVGTVYWWCPIEQHHDRYGHVCKDFEQGEPKKYDKHGRLMKK